MATEAPLSSQDKTSTRRVTLADVLIVLGFALFAFTYHLGRWQGVTPFVFLGGDGANIASFAAALDHPESFKNDELLGDPANFRIYSAIHIQLIRTLAKVTGDYGTAFILLLGLHVFLQALGFYILGRVLFQSRFWATLFTVITLMPVTLYLGEYWGIHEDPQPRFSFQTLLPYLLAAAFYWRTKPSAWPWLMVAVGALMYVHPISVPIWGLALWLGLWAFHPTSWSLVKRVGYMFLLGILFLTVSAPTLLNYAQNYASSPTNSTEFNQVYTMMNAIYGDFMDVAISLKGSIAWWKDKWFYWPWALVGIGLVLWLRREDRKSVYLVSLWVVGILLASIVLPWIEQAIARASHRLPTQLDLIRGIRYLVPMMLLFCLWPLAEIAKRLYGTQTKQLAQKGVYLVGIALVAGWIYWHPPDQLMKALTCWTQGKFVCIPPEWPEAIEALAAVKNQTPPGSTILPTVYSLPIRYEALRPVVYSYKDGGLFGYTNYSKLLQWYERHQEMQEIDASKDPEFKLRNLVALSEKWGAQYLFIDFNFHPALTYLLGIEPVWSNPKFALLKIERNATNQTVKAMKAEANPPNSLYDPQLLIDGRLSTGWFSDLSRSPMEPQELRFDLGQAQTVDRVVLVPWSKGYGFPETFSLEASPDGVHWQSLSLTRAAMQATFSEDAPTFTFSPVQARYVKLIVSKMPPAKTLHVFHPSARWPDSEGKLKIEMGRGVTMKSDCPDRFFDFNGTDSYVQIEDSSSWKPSQLTLSVWFKADALDGQLHSLIRQDASEHFGYWLAWDNRGGRNHIWWEIGDGHDGLENRPAHFHTLLAPIDLKAGEWTHVITTFDGKELKVYQGSKLVGSEVYADKIIYRPDPVFIGSLDHPSGLYGWNGWKGEIVSIVVYDWNLEQSEIEELAALPWGSCWLSSMGNMDRDSWYRFGLKEVIFSLGGAR